MATIEEAINAHIQNYDKRKSQLQNPLLKREMDVWIDTLKSVPRDLVEIQKVIKRKEQKHKAMILVEEAQQTEFLDVWSLT